mgnify:CR=1 FL=1
MGRLDESERALQVTLSNISTICGELLVELYAARPELRADGYANELLELLAEAGLDDEDEIDLELLRQAKRERELNGSGKAGA